MGGACKYREALNEGREKLRGAGIADADSDAWILLEHVTGMSRARFFADGDLAMKEEEEQAYRKLIERRSLRIPVQHLTGVQEFMGYEFKVSRDVLVPRQDTEVLVEEAEKCLEREEGNSPRQGQRSCGANRGAVPDRNPIRVLDLCTGSGCIAISMKKRNPSLLCTGADISEAALGISRENAANLGAEVAFVRSDMFAELPRAEEGYDLIVSNPPYIPTKVIASLEEEVRLHDPEGALDGGEDGLSFYRILAEESPGFLRDGGHLCMEIGHDQSAAVEELLRREGFTCVYTKKDLAGLDRVVCGVYYKNEKI